MIKMPMSEIIDRYAISLIKQEEIEEDVSEELETYKKEIDQHTNPKIKEYIDRLYKANKDLWNEEKAIKMGQEQNFDLAEIGKKALKVRDLNRIRNGIKAEIVDEFADGFKEIKVNYTKRDYAGK